MKTVMLNRAIMTNEITLGMMYVHEVKHQTIYTLELPWLKNQQSISCVPAGVYLCKSYTSNKFRNVFQLTKVQDRTKILIHAGNSTKDTYGCIIPGLTASNLRVYESRDAIKLLRSILHKEAFMLQIQEARR